jgi:hypothetical protein
VKLPATLNGVLTTLFELVFGREKVLPIGRVPSVSGAAKWGDHSLALRGEFATAIADDARRFSSSKSRIAPRTSAGTRTWSMNSRSTGSIAGDRDAPTFEDVDMGN